ncbi:MAG: TonB-dependent receptor plug domain-containing protein [Longimicrobiales bacterium]
MRTLVPSQTVLKTRHFGRRFGIAWTQSSSTVLSILFLGLWHFATVGVSAQRVPERPTLSPPIDLEGFLVTADRLARPAWTVPSAATVVSGLDLERAGIQYVADALRLIPGVSVARSGSYGATTSLFVRGGESDYVQVLVDGMQVNEPGGAFDFGSLTTDHIERIEVVRGPASAVYGSDAVSGVIQIFTKRGRGAPVGWVTAGGGSHGARSWDAGLAGGTDRVSYSFSASRTDTDGILAFNNQHFATTIGGRVAVQPDESTDLSISARYHDTEFHFPTDGAGAIVDENAFTFGDGYTLAANATRSWTDQLSTQITLGASDTDSGTDDAQDSAADSLGFFAFTSLDRTERHRADVRALWEPRAGTILTAGYELERQQRRGTSLSTSEFGASPGSSENRRWNRGYYAQIAQGTDQLALTGGLRLENNDRFGSAATYRGGAVWRSKTSGTRVRASIGTGIKEPTFFENFAAGFSVGNPDLEPERSRSVEVGWDQSLGRLPLTVSVTGFDQRFRDLIQFTFPAPTEGGPNFFNLAEASSRGLELAVSATTGPVRMQVAYTLLDTEVVDSGADEGEGATFVEGSRLLRRPTHEVAAAATLRLQRRASLDVSVRHVGARDDRDFSAFPAAPVVLPGHTVVDLGGEFTLVRASGPRPGLSATLRLENALDQEYQEVLAFRAPGRALYLGGRVTFGARGRGGSP